MVENKCFIRLLSVFAGVIYISSSVFSQCPRVEAILVDACSTESLNEFVIIHSGSSGFNTNDLSVDFPAGNNQMSVSNNDINTNVDNWPPGTPCGLVNGNPSAYTGCSNIIPVGQGFDVPPNSILILQTSNGSQNGVYDFSSLCGSDQCVYVISNSCTRTIGAFSNSTSTGLRTTTFDFGGGCQDVVTYDCQALIGDNGDYYLPETGTYGSNGCVVPPSSPAPNPQPATFDPIGPFCEGENFTLPSTSNEGFTGTWSPDINNMMTTTYTFYPTGGQCASSTQITVVINAPVDPIFDPVGPFCQGTSFTLPTTSNNGITGTWSPAINNMMTTTYTFTPSAGECANTTTLEVVIETPTDPIFDPVGPFCQGTSFTLPATSNNGITGTWSPAINNMMTTTYTFTPSAGECANTTTLEVVIETPTDPIFDPVGPFCQGTSFNLPTTSNNGITGTWSPAPNPNATTVYIFTPDAGQCASSIQITVVINPPVDPIFNPVGPLCEGTAFTLPGTSNNGITGLWSPAPNPNVTTTYTFTPDAGQCATSTTMEVVINTSPRVSLTGGGNLCRGQCYEIGFILTGGSGLYNLELNLSSPPLLNFNFPAAGIDASSVLTICYQGSVPNFDPNTLTFSIPTFITGSGTLSIVGITDANTGCTGIIESPGSLTITLLPSPTANTPPDITACDDGSGTAIFDLAPQIPIILGGQGGTVRFFTDPNLTNEVFSPYTSGSTTLYAVVVASNGCSSPAVEFDLIVVNNGNVGDVRIECGGGETNCLICYYGSPQSVAISFIFPNPSSSYDVVMSYTINGVSNTFTGTFPGTGGQQSFIVNGPSFFQLISVSQDGSCPDVTDLGDPVIIDLYLEPTLDTLPNLSACGSIVLPPITGTNLSGNQAYYTGPGGSGQIYYPGQTITQGLVLYAYDGITGCFDEIQISIDVQPITIYDQPSDVSGCNGYVLPPITGANVGPSAGYYTGINGTGTYYPPGSLITFPVTLYIFDINNNCFDNQPVFNVNVAVGPQVFSMPDVAACEQYILPPIDGQNLTGNQAYYTLPNGNGIRMNAGDLITQSGRIYIFDEVIDCQTQESFFVRIDTFINPGISHTLVFCIGQDTFVNLFQVLGQGAAEGGTWIDTLNLGLDFSKPDSVNIKSLAVNTYHFIYKVDGGLCGLDSATASLQLINPPMAGLDSNFVFCGAAPSTLNLEEWLRNNSGVGEWTWQSGIGPDLSDPSNVDLSGLPTGQYQLSFSTLPGENCPTDTARFDIEILNPNEAGIDVSSTLCSGSTINLEDLLINNNAVGVFVDSANTGALIGNIVNTNLLGEGSYAFFHILPGDQICTGDTAIITLNVSSIVSAGLDSTSILCETGIIDVRQLLRDASPGGNFNLIGGASGASLIGSNLIINDSGVFQISYSVGDGVICPIDEAELTIEVISRPQVTVLLNHPFFCEGESINFEIAYSYFDNIDIRWAVKDLAEKDRPGQGVNLSYTYNNQPPIGSLTFDANNLGLQPGVQYFIGVELIAGDFCEYSLFDQTAVPFEIVKKDSTFLTPTVCHGESVEIMGVIFDVTNTEESFQLQNTNGCDSLVFVNLTILPEIVSSFTATLCRDQEANIGGNLFNESNPMGTVVLPAASVTGCDSTIIVQLDFQDASLNFINDFLCRGSSVTYNGKLYDENRLTGLDTLDIPSVGGCDSVLVINLTLVEPSAGAASFNTCDQSFSVNLEGNIYDFNNPSGQFISSMPNINGCDSVVNVSINFLPEASSNLNPIVCSGDSFTLGGETFDQDNPTGIVRFAGQAANGCDSIVYVRLSFIEPAMGEFTQFTCDPEFNISIGGIVFDAGNPTGVAILENAAANGCDSMVNVEIVFLESIQGTMDLNTCNQNFSIVIGNTTFDVNNPSGVVILPQAAANGCDSIVNVSINFSAPSLEISVEESPCPGETGTLEILSFGGQGPFTISGTFSSELTANTLPLSIPGISPGTYTLQIVSADQCSSTAQFTIVTLPEPVVNISSTIAAGGFQLMVSSNTELYNLVWTPAEKLSCNDCPNPQASEPGNYTLVYQYGSDCTGQISIFLELEKGGEFFVPNAIRTGSLSKNSWFYIDKSSELDARGLSLRVYDRWGNLMFEKLNFELGVHTEGWNGTFRNSSPVSPGVYVYVAEVILGNGVKVLLKGSITVIN